MASRSMLNPGFYHMLIRAPNNAKLKMKRRKKLWASVKKIKNNKTKRRGNQ